jgi:hypothetical protein
MYIMLFDFALKTLMTIFVMRVNRSSRVLLMVLDQWGYFDDLYNSLRQYATS